MTIQALRAAVAAAYAKSAQPIERQMTARNARRLARAKRPSEGRKAHLYSASER